MGLQQRLQHACVDLDAHFTQTRKVLVPLACGCLRACAVVLGRALLLGVSAAAGPATGPWVAPTESATSMAAAKRTLAVIEEPA